MIIVFILLLPVLSAPLPNVTLVSTTTHQSNDTLTITLSGTFNLTTTIQSTQLPTQPWHLTSSFNFSALSGNISTEAAGAASASGNGATTGTALSTPSKLGVAVGTSSGNHGEAGGMAVGGVILVNKQRIAGFGAVNATAKNGGASGALTSLQGGCVTVGAQDGNGGLRKDCSNGGGRIQRIEGEQNGGVAKTEGKGDGVGIAIGAGRGGEIWGGGGIQGIHGEGGVISGGVGVDNAAGGGIGIAGKVGEGWVEGSSLKGVKKGLAGGGGRGKGKGGGGGGVAVSGGSEGRGGGRIGDVEIVGVQVGV